MSDSPTDRALLVLAEPLVLLVELDRTCSLTSVATRLDIPQSTLSRRLVRWQEALGFDLVEQQGRTLVLTRHGALLARQAEPALDLLRTGLAEIDGARSPVRIGCMRSLTPLLGADLVNEAAGRGHLVSMSEGSAQDLLTKLATGLLDLVVVAPRPPGDQWAWHPLIDQEMVLTVSADHALAGRSSVRLDEVADEPFLAISSNFTTRDLVDELFAEQGLRARTILEADDVRTLRNYVALGTGLAVLPYEGSTDDRIREVRIGRPDGSRAEREGGLVWRASARLPESVQQIVHSLTSYPVTEVTIPTRP